MGIAPGPARWLAMYHGATLEAGPEVIERTPHAPPALVQHVRGDHRRADVAVAEHCWIARIRRSNLWTWSFYPALVPLLICMAGLLFTRAIVGQHVIYRFVAIPTAFGIVWMSVWMLSRFLAKDYEAWYDRLGYEAPHHGTGLVVGAISFLVCAFAAFYFLAELSGDPIEFQ